MTMAEATIKFEMDTTECQKLIEDARQEFAAKYSWQPIETAPKDGTEILLFELTFNGAPYMFTAKWDSEDADWKCIEFEAYDHNPTYWMPLPEPPTQ